MCNTDTEVHIVSMKLRHAAKSSRQHIEVHVKVHMHNCTPYNDRTELNRSDLFSMSYFSRIPLMTSLDSLSSGPPQKNYILSSSLLNIQLFWRNNSWWLFLWVIKNFRSSSPKLSKILPVIKHNKNMFVKKQFLSKSFSL